MCFFSCTKHHDLVERDGLGMPEAEDANPIKLACQQTRACSDCRSRNDKYQHAFARHPAIALLQKNQFHPLITVWSELSVVWRIQVQEGACFRQHFALKSAA